MNWFSRNTGLMVKTFLYQIVMSLFGFMMYGATYKIPLLLIVGQATVILFFFYIMSSQMYQSGAKTCEYDRAHGESSSPAAGFLFAVIAFLPTFILAIISLVSPPFFADGTSNTVGYLSYLGNHTFLQGMYVGITQTLYPTSAGGANEALAAANAAAINSRCSLHLFGAIPGALVGGIGYMMGYLGFKKDKKKTK
ncbi:MAG: hypothetical protein IJC26_07850 [Clostridia bacterium]|nr:hypothetical protein [Clostridia bacterium]